MADGGPPVNVQSFFNLGHFGIHPDQVTWSRVTLSSDKWVAVRHGFLDPDSKRSTVTVLNPNDGTISYVGQSSADSVQMNPSQPIVALKAGLRFEIFNLESKLLISKAKMNDPVIYWTWLNADIIAIVTDTAVYHWDLWQADCLPERIFTRHPRLAFSEIVSYKTDRSMKWLAVTGLIPEDDRISGITQLFNVDEDITQCICAHVVCFTHYHFQDNPYPSTLLCVCSRDIQANGKVHVIELGPYKPGNFAPRNNYDHIQYMDDIERYDFPVALHVSRQYGLLFVITKYGYLYLCDMETAACLCCTRLSTDIIFTSTLNASGQGIMGITKGGQVIMIDLKKDNLVPYVRETAKKANQASRLERTFAR